MDDQREAISDERRREAYRNAASNLLAFGDAAGVTSDYTTHDWLCPFDGLATVRLSQYTGREYVGCPKCHSFARPGTPPPLALETDRTATLRRLVAATAPLF